MTKTKAIRWGLGTRSESVDARSRLLDAARDCYARIGIAKTSMADIAAEAKITRRTVYRYFSSHEEILHAVVRRETDKFWGTLYKELSGVKSFGEFLVEALIYTLHQGPKIATHNFLFGREILSIVNEMYICNREYLTDLAESWRPLYDQLKRRGEPELDLDLLMIGEWFSRLSISYLAAPSAFYHSEDELRGLFRNMLLPVFSKRD